MNPSVSAIVLNWNGVHHLEEALPTLASQSYAPLEVLVVDNGSSENSEDVTRRSGAVWHRLPTNVGLARALNVGAKAARGDVLLFLNNDMRFHPEFVSSMVTELMRDKDVFAVDATQYDWEGAAKVHQATFLSDERSESTSEVVPGLYLTQRMSERPCRVFAANGANLMVRRSMFDAVGGLDERMAMGFEDLDLCWRGWLKGWHCVYAPDAICWHRVSAASFSSEGRRSRFRGAVGGRVLFATKFLPWSHAARVWGAMLGGWARDVTGIFMPDRFPAERYRMIKQAIRYLPSLVRERAKWYREAHTTPDDQLRHMLALSRADTHQPTPHPSSLP